MAPFDFARLRLATLRTNGFGTLFPFALSVASLSLQASEVEGRPHKLIRVSLGSAFRASLPS